jgi:YfiH family protein
MTGAHARFTTRADGDLVMSNEAGRTHLNQVHGSDVVTVAWPGQHAGIDADAAVTAATGAVLCVRVADCAPIALLGERAVGVVHAGWRGVVAGVIGNAVAALGRLDDGPIRALVGPSIEPACYEFGSDDLDSVAALVGGAARGLTSAGRPALDLRAAVRAQLLAAGVDEVEIDPRCTACDPALWSYRGASDRERQGVLAWIEP